MKVYAVLGDPIEHSLSPVMHNAAFQAMGLQASYHAFRVKIPRLRDAILGADAMGFGGLNLTIPLKESAISVVEPDETAEAIGAANTVSFQRGIRGHNTDGIGASLALRHYGVNVRGADVLLIGAGGAARAIAYQLSKDGAEIVVTNRTPERGLALASDLGLEFRPFGEIDDLVRVSDVVINATSVGMRDGDPRLFDGSILKAEQVVFDIIYSRETELLRDARRAGAKAIDGVMMLVYQGAAAFRIWTGLDEPVDVMEAAVRAALGRLNL
ncbi:MAG: shikimate dehydrogenase [Methanothrix sp.]|uniref:Shikimate dehydrogenase (NADP(+)) n=1 Tax=Methanothrix thermoacetophila (strain DSM 6194 / JCM 14653 / NBRC 101360 / PT) TaxID=349307 RepID=AROE_METTP|nr:RecName: Full=Shikimate dehydrogenase (NADP(+)); Short=SDH [Methanothrix thermoacetophila PT]ABK15273.1 shikimate dehydrogenase [Methanothrix thermoacetophila PT]MBC7080522.1 shikimate dehydrogenase [Methanothrix sp.]NPU87310.1 shikimate dehydrogenase [Methanothrix sp.]